MTRLALSVQGVVQGVGFRPFAYRAAVARGLSGWVENGKGGVRIEVQGPDAALEGFIAALQSELPAPGRVDHIERTVVEQQPESRFVIRQSREGGSVQPTLPADLATCPECLREISDPGERRYRYPFTNCTRCGPRYSIVEGLPYDRVRTSMKGFTLCADCAREYADPLDRRFDAQPIACSRCGPELELLGSDSASEARGDAALQGAAELLVDGKVLALRGLGGFQLLVDATNPEAVAALRQRKRRDAKPFAVMFRDLEAARDNCRLSAAEERALLSPEAPIVLVRRAGAALVEGVAPGNPWVGAMLPYTPLHHLLLRELGRPVVCTSGNLSTEPMCVATNEALERLRDLADAWLVHDRPIVRPVDDSVARVGPAGLELLRRARGYAPQPVARLPSESSVLALGAHKKGSIALGIGGQVVTSQHLGDLENVESVALLERTVDDLLRFFDCRPDIVACDLHPDYASTRLAEKLAAGWNVPLVRVQHHHAHVAACVAEHDLAGPVLGLSWDGTGHGSDGTAWGGEALVCEGAGFERQATLLPFPLPGGDRAAREPRRAALGLWSVVDEESALAEAERWFSPDEARTLYRACRAGLNAPLTSSIGRLFDGVAAMLGLSARQSFEGQAAMSLEFAADAAAGDAEPYPFPLGDGPPPWIADWRPLLTAIRADRDRGAPVPSMAARFHAALVALGADIARRAGYRQVVLSGGCFQNLRLATTMRQRLEAMGLSVWGAGQVPANDGGVSVGQALIACRQQG